MSNKKKRNISGTEVKIRKAGMSDMADLYKWRNHPEIRKNFFNTCIVSLEEHEKWFNAKIKAADTTIYMAFCKNNKIGSIRFEDRGEVIKASVMLNPDFLGKGFGSELIRTGIKQFLTENKSDKPVVAEIKTENIASLKAFKRAGFIESYITCI